jgi:hypothetical protein
MNAEGGGHLDEFAIPIELEKDPAAAPDSCHGVLVEHRQEVSKAVGRNKRLEQGRGA